MNVEDADSLEYVSSVRPGDGANEAMLSDDERDPLENSANERFDLFGRAIVHLADACENIVEKALGQAKIETHPLDRAERLERRRRLAQRRAGRLIDGNLAAEELA